MLGKQISHIEAFWFCKGVQECNPHFDINPEKFSQYVIDYMYKNDADMTRTISDLFKDWCKEYPPKLMPAFYPH